MIWRIMRRHFMKKLRIFLHQISQQGSILSWQKIEFQFRQWPIGFCDFITMHKYV